MADQSGIDTVEVDEGRTGTYDYTFDDIHSDTDITTELFENDQDTRGDTYFTGSTIDGAVVLPDMDDDTGTDRTSDVIALMTGDNYHRIRITRFDGNSVVVDKTKVRLMQETNSNVGNVDAWSLMFRDVDTSGIFYYN